jgi:protein-S-isoprenylcysteine O-methyltransferase Ste14
LGWALGITAILTAKPNGTWLATGVSIAVAGELLRVWAAGHLNKDRVLAMTGPYRWTRNPLYFGTLFVGVGFALATGRALWVLVVVALFVSIYAPVMKREARRLTAAFPGYEDYAARVPLFWPRRRHLDSGTGSAKPERVSFSWERVSRNREHITVLGVVAVIAILTAKLYGG